MINELKHRLGNKCSAININGEISGINIPSKLMKLCEALNYSFDVPIQINNNNIGCLGARRSLGLDNNSKKLGAFISENTNIPSSFINKAFENTPRIGGEFLPINLGITSDIEKMFPPDLFIAVVKPARITEIMHVFAQHNIHPSIPPYSLLSVCGNVFANSYVNRVLSISFGCPESRKYGGIEDNEVVLGIPAEIAKYLLN